jgi:hypothetical protein
VIVRQPSATEDRPPIASAAVVGGLCLAIGLWLAHAAMGHPVIESGSGSESGSGRDERDVEPDRVVDAIPPTSVAPEPTPTLESPTTATPAIEAPVVEAPVAATPTATPAPRPVPSTPRAAPVVGTGTATRVAHGRVAYLRCDGAPQTSGPFPCPRDAALEATVWSAVDQAIACAPPLPPGQADLVLEFDRAATPELTVSTRDTFPDEAIRTDAAGVVACLGPALATATTTIPGDLIRVGFRFTLL